MRKTNKYIKGLYISTMRVTKHGITKLMSELSTFYQHNTSIEYMDIKQVNFKGQTSIS